MVISVVVSTKIADFWASEQLLNRGTMNSLKSAKNWLKYASNYSTRPMCITNRTFLRPCLSTMPSDEPGFCSYAQGISRQQKCAYKYNVDHALLSADATELSRLKQMQCAGCVLYRALVCVVMPIDYTSVSQVLCMLQLIIESYWLSCHNN